jgi:hypothetical protein
MIMLPFVFGFEGHVWIIDFVHSVIVVYPLFLFGIGMWHMDLLIQIKEERKQAINEMKLSKQIFFLSCAHFDDCCNTLYVSKM